MVHRVDSHLTDIRARIVELEAFSAEQRDIRELSEGDARIVCTPDLAKLRLP